MIWKYNIIIFVLVLALSFPLYSQTSIDFDQISGTAYYSSPLDIVEDGVTFVLAMTGGNLSEAFSSLEAYPGELLLGSGINTVKITITHKNDFIFDFISIDILGGYGTTNWTVKGYKDGSEISGSPANISGNQSNYTTIPIGFEQVDKVTIEENPVVPEGFSIWCDKFIVANITDPSLPVELVSFSATSKSKTVGLEWSTASESDNLGFILERKTKKSGWQHIATYQTYDALLGQGTTSSLTQYSYTDVNVTAGESYTYRLSDVNTNGKVTEIGTTTIETAALPVQTQLLAAYPNPFNPSTNLNYQLANDSYVTLAVYDVLGRQVAILVNQQQSAGEYSVQWDGMNNAGESAPSGAYLVRLQANGFNQVNKVLYIK